MRKLFSILIMFGLASAVWAHSTLPSNGGRMTIVYGETENPGIEVIHFEGEACTVTAEAVEIVVGTPLLSIQSAGQQPALDVNLSIAPTRHPANGQETTAVQLSWRATGFTAAGSADPGCNGAGEVLFNVTVVEPVARTVANLATPAITPTDPVSLLSGEFFFDEKPDIYPGGPMPLNFTRYYASRLKPGGAAPSPLGEHWSHNFRFYLTAPSSGAVTVEDNRGRVLTFERSGPAFTLSSPTFAAYQLVSTSAGYTLGDAIEGRFYNFNSSGALVSIQDRAGNSHALTYTAGNLTGISDGLGRDLTLAYDSSNRIVSVSDGTRTVRYAYTGSNLTSFTDVRGNVTQYAYDSSNALPGLMTQKTLPLGNIATAQVWDSTGRVTSQSDGSQNTVSFAYGPGLSTVQTDPAGNAQKYVFNASGLLLSLTDENGSTSTYTYDSAGRQATATSSLGYQTLTAFDPASGKPLTYAEPDGSVTAYTYATQTQSGIAFRVLTKIAYPDGSAQTMNYDASGNVTSFTDRAGKTTSITYNARGQVLTMTNPAAGVTTLTYGTDGSVSSVRDAAGNTTTIGYDALRRANLVTHPDGSTRSYTLDADAHQLTDTDERGMTAHFTYDANGNLTSITDPRGNVTSFGYDALDRAVSVTDPSGGRTSRTFDSIGRVASRTDRNGNTFTFTYDPASRLTSVTDPASNVWRRTYDTEGFPLSYADPLNNTWTYNRDSLGRLVKSTSPGNAATSIAYDQAGRVSSFTDPAGVTTLFTSDPRGVLAGVSQGNGLVSIALARSDLGLVTQLTDANGQLWRRSYDTRGRTLSATDPLGAVTTMAYDSMNRVSQIVFPGQLGGVQFTYDNMGHTVRKLYSDGTDLGFTFDDASRLTAAAGLTVAYDPVGEISSTNGIAIARDAGGRIVSMSFAPGKSVSYAYDRRDLLTRVTDWVGGVSTFSYDAASRLTSMTRPNGVTASFTYNADNAVTGVQEAGSAQLSSIAAQRDGRGRITSVTRNVPLQATPGAGSRDFSYDAASQVSGYSYDALGRLISDVGRSYTWDLASRLTSYTDSAGPVSLTYDAFGRRTSRARAGATQNYVWNYALKLQSISIVRQNGSDLRYYVHTPGGALLYSIEAADNTRHFYHFDEVGNTVYLTDDNANVTDAYAYTPDGVPLERTGNTDNPFTFAGRSGAMQESAAGLYYMRARYYDAANARFLSRDPARRSFVPNETNVYTYARMNPLLFGDPNGLNAQVHSDGTHTDFQVDVWKNGQIIGTLSASFGEGGYRDSGGYGGVLWGGQGTFVLSFQPGQCITQNAGASNTFVAGGRRQDERAARAILSSVDFSSINLPQYPPGTPAADFLLARLKELGPTASGEVRSVLGFKTARGSGNWTSYGVIYPARTCNTFTGEMLNVYFGTNEDTGVLADSVTENLNAQLRAFPEAVGR